jgi:hypothetical protein
MIDVELVGFLRIFGHAKAANNMNGLLDFACFYNHFAIVKGIKVYYFASDFIFSVHFRMYGCR